MYRMYICNYRLNCRLTIVSKYKQQYIIQATDVIRHSCLGKKIVTRHQKSNSYIASLQGRAYVCSHSRPNIYLRLHLSWGGESPPGTKTLLQDLRKKLNENTVNQFLASQQYFNLHQIFTFPQNCRKTPLLQMALAVCWLNCPLWKFPSNWIIQHTLSLTVAGTHHHHQRHHQDKGKVQNKNKK